MIRRLLDALLAPPNFRIIKVGETYWLSRNGWCQGRYPTLAEAINQRIQHGDL